MRDLPWLILIVSGLLVMIFLVSVMPKVQYEYKTVEGNVIDVQIDYGYPTKLSKLISEKKATFMNITFDNNESCSGFYFDDYVDLTVNSKLIVTYSRSYQKAPWSDEPIYISDYWTIEKIIKVPDGV